MALNAFEPKPGSDQDCAAKLSEFVRPPLRATQKYDLRISEGIESVQIVDATTGKIIIMEFKPIDVNRLAICAELLSLKLTIASIAEGKLELDVLPSGNSAVLYQIATGNVRIEKEKSGSLGDLAMFKEFRKIIYTKHIEPMTREPVNQWPSQPNHPIETCFF